MSNTKGNSKGSDTGHELPGAIWVASAWKNSIALRDKQEILRWLHKEALHLLERGQVA